MGKSGSLGEKTNSLLSPVDGLYLTKTDSGGSRVNANDFNKELY